MNQPELPPPDDPIEIAPDLQVFFPARWKNGTALSR
jgi:hypothetical protein